MPNKERNPGTSPRTARANWAETSLKTPGYYTLRQQRKFLPVEPYNFQNYTGKGTVADIPGTAFKAAVLDNSEGGFYIVPYILGTMPGITESTNLAALLTTRVASKLRVKIQSTSMMLPVTIVEAKKTVRSVASIARDIATSFRALCRGQPREAINVMIYGSQGGARTTTLDGALAKRWLEWSYAVKPMVYDAQGLALGLAKVVTHERNSLMHIKATDREFFDRKAGQLNPLPNQLYNQQQASGSLSCKGEVWAKMGQLTDQVLDDSGFSDILGSAWELIPYSFVVDWFLPIGNWLSSFRPINNMTFVSGCYYLKCMNGQINLKGGRWLGLYPYTSTANIRSQWKNRVRITSWPDFTMPGLNWDLSVNELLSGMSLLIGGLGLGRRTL